MSDDDDDDEGGDDDDDGDDGDDFLWTGRLPYRPAATPTRPVEHALCSMMALSAYCRQARCWADSGRTCKHVFIQT